ncbi:MAG TPA: NAD+ synthase [Nitrososphaeria archaeon]|nr:NAD+ synthase [Nitrososphaeria archaeon]
MIPPELNYDEVAEKIINFIQERVEEADANGAVVGASGGLDSSVVLVLSVKALGAGRVVALIMPDLSVTPIQDIEHAVQLAKLLGVRYYVVDVRRIYNSYSDIMPFYASDALIPNGNLRARIRMTVLYYYANLRNLLVCGTGDKSEILLGYFTKYGDGAADLLPIADLYKTQVREFARKLDLPKSIIEKPSSPRLWPGQTAEKELGATYDEIDKILYLHVELGKKIEEIIDQTGIESEKVRAIVERFHRSEHKRRLPPIAKIG